MVLLTMTAAIVAALGKVQTAPDEVGHEDAEIEHWSSATSEPKLSEPLEGNPISHGQVLSLSRQLKIQGHSPYHLDILLRGSKVYVAPPPPKPEPTPEYKALMARLRREEESRAYERMINPLPPMDMFSDRFPTSSAAYAFSSTASYPSLKPLDDNKDDDLTYADVNRQVALVFNVLVSIFACAAAIWMVARWWPTPARLALTMSGSILVGVAEVVVYSGYLRRIAEAKGKEAKIKEVKEIVQTWVVGGDDEDGSKMDKEVIIPSVENGEAKELNVRKRK